MKKYKLPSLSQAVSAINKNGILLVFPVNNWPEPHSLWSEFYPRLKMKWEWSDDGDDRVAHMWGLMKRLSDCSQVIYSKWYQGRATFFSRSLFAAMLSLQMKQKNLRQGLPFRSSDILEALEECSPLSTKDIKRTTELQGKYHEPTYNKSMKILFQRQLIVGFGEVEDGAFPSLAVAATHLIYEELWSEASEMSLSEAQLIVDRFMPLGSATRRFFDRVLRL